MSSTNLKKKVIITITDDGKRKFIYDETIPGLLDGTNEIKRASNVEPDNDGKWYADMSPSNGPKLTGFTKRSDAITQEIEWLQKNIL